MIINGIEFPNKIIKSIENKSLVVFVGAGVSMGAPTCLPSFDKLAEDIACGTTYVKKNNEPCDVFLGRVKFGKIDVNEIAAEMLSRLDLKPNKLHEYLINLFNEDEQIKIVTTNYDQMLEIAAKQLCRGTKTYDAPALPLGNDIHGIIHLHGNISNPNYMVITDSDFGRAYMVNGYASRFLVELFAKYTVLFVGYSYNDVIMRYLTRAMVNDGDSNRYILTDDNQSEWAQLGLNPIIYPSQDYDSLYSGIKHLGEIVNRIETGDVIQFSNIEDATINFCEKVNEVNNPGLNFQEVGRLLQDDGIERKVGAYVKYGENHTKTAQTLGLAFELCNTYYLSGVGYIFLELNEEDREKLLTRMILRSKLFTRMMQASSNGKVNMREFLYMLSDSTYVRRRSNVKKMMGYLIQSEEYNFSDFVDVIEL